MTNKKEKRYDNLIKKYAMQYEIPWELFKAMIKAESNFNPKAKSHCGAIGLCQLMPYTAKEMGVKDPYDVGQNLNGGARYLKRMYNIFKKEEGIERWRFALGAYNTGWKDVVVAQEYADQYDAKNYKWCHIVLFLHLTGCGYLETSEYVDKVIMFMYDYIYEDIKTNGGKSENEN